MFLPSPSGPPLKVGILRSSSIGDVVLSTACLDLLRKLKIPKEITWIGKEPALSLLKEAFPEIRFVEIKNGMQVRKIVEQLHDLHFLIDLQTNFRSRIIAQSFKRTYRRPVYNCSKLQLQRSRLVLEGRIYGRSRLLPRRAQEAIKPQYKMMSDTLNDALNRHLPAEMRDGIGTEQPIPFLPTTHDQGTQQWRKELQFGYWLAIAPGASYETKRAPLDIFTGIITETVKILTEQLQLTKPLSLLLLGDTNDRAMSIELLDQLGWTGSVLNLAGRLSLWETTLALEGANCLVSNDTSLSHMAEAVGTPCAVLFGPTVEGFGFAPRMRESRSFSIPLGCRPCSKHGKAPCRFGDKKCFTGINKEEVAQFIAQTILTKKQQGLLV